MLYREPKLLKVGPIEFDGEPFGQVSVLYREPKLLKEVNAGDGGYYTRVVSVLYREPKLLKDAFRTAVAAEISRFSALP